jgi:aspartyl-tRNA(Asn)/glutamyl-tRNA(Gln) amidotransferase subunit A
VPTPPAALTATDLRDAVLSRSITAAEAVRSALDAIARLNPALNAFTEVHADRALARAGEIDARLAARERPGPLAGVPVALKDNICLAHGRTTAGSRILAEYGSPFSATAAERLEAAGAVVVGKTNLDEFGMGSSTEHSVHGPTANPFDPARTPGGSSGGSAAAVAARLVPAALGSDTGGSIRQPAGMCGVVGFKPSYGRVSRYGLVAYASSLDQIGPLTRSVADAALVASAIMGPDRHDSTCLASPAPDLLTHLEREPEHLTVGVPRQARSPANHPGVAAALERAAHALAGAGASVVEIDLPLTDHAIAAYYLIATAEASSNLARFDGVRYGRRAALRPGEDLAALYARSRAEGLGPEVQRRIMLGTHALSSGYYDAYYATAQKVRRLIRAEFDRAFNDRDLGPAGGCHAVLMPCSPSPAWRTGAKAGDPLSEYLEDVYTVAVNLAGLPAVALPAGLADDGGAKLPVGVQLIGAAGEDALLLRVARVLERLLGPGPKPPLA